MIWTYNFHKLLFWLVSLFQDIILEFQDTVCHYFNLYLYFRSLCQLTIPIISTWKLFLRSHVAHDSNEILCHYINVKPLLLFWFYLIIKFVEDIIILCWLVSLINYVIILNYFRIFLNVFFFYSEMLCWHFKISSLYFDIHLYFKITC